MLVVLSISLPSIKSDDVFDSSSFVEVMLSKLCSGLFDLLFSTTHEEDSVDTTIARFERIIPLLNFISALVYHISFHSLAVRIVLEAVLRVHL